MTDRVGEQLGNYRLVRLLGRGGFAEVYLGEHIYLKSYAALKVLHRQLVEDEVSQFIREAQSLARLNHAGIVRVLDFAVQDSIPFLVTEYAAHGTLRERYPKGTRVPLAPLISYVQQIAAALHYAHSLQLIHRDIKPENMLVGAHQEVLLADFGLVMFTPDEHQTVERSLAGSLPYMAPEQLRGEPVPASDQYALGIVVYEWLCGRRPFEGTPAELTKMHLSSPPPSPRLLLPSLPAAVEYVIMRALAKEPEQRFASVHDFANALYHASQEAIFSSATPVGGISTGAKEQRDIAVAIYERAVLEPMTDPTQPLKADEAVVSDNPLVIEHEQQEQPQTSQTQDGQLWNVPTALTPLLGRELEVLTGCTLLKRPDVRLLTLLGTGGIGKTRLSIEVASRLRTEPDFENGICFVALAAVNEPEMVMPTIARALGLVQKDVPTFEQIKAFLREKHLLLVLDNLEQVVAVAPQVAQLLIACPALKILATSRIALHVQGEQQIQLPSLPMPDLNQLPNKTAVAQFASVMLFVQRAQMVQPTFQVTQDNVKAIAEICVRLDGLPLAIELAAARVKLLPPSALLARLSNRLRLLTRGPDSLPERQQTLRNTIQWSYDLLDEREQRLFRLLSIFIGGSTLSAVEALYATLDGEESDSTLSVLDDLETLIDNSLLQMHEQSGDATEPRLLMLETIREYGRESLQASGELAAAQLAHANYYLSLAETAQQEHEGAQQSLWSERLERDYDNLRSVMEWALSKEASNIADSSYQREVALRLGAALENFWVTRGYIREGLTLVERALATGASNDAYYACALNTAARLQSFLGNLEQARTQMEQSLTLLRALKDEERVGYTLRALGWIAHLKGQFEQARVLYEESLAIFRALNDTKGTGDVLLNMGYLRQFLGDFEQSRALFEEYLAIQRERENQQGIANALYQLAQLLFSELSNPPLQQIHAMLDEALAISRTTGDKRAMAHMQRLLGHVAYLEKDITTAHELLEECIQFYQHSKEWQGLGQSLILLARIVIEQGNFARARLLIEESRTVAKEAGDSEQVLVESLECMAALSVAQGQNVRATRLYGAAAHMRQKANLLMWDSEKREYEQTIATLRDFLGENMFATLWSEGQAMSVDEVFSARGAAAPAMPTTTRQPGEKTPVKKPVRYPGGLSSREVDVLRLVAQGLTDIQIADRLVISPRTVTTHLTSIYNKLGVTSRAAATRFAVEHHIA